MWRRSLAVEGVLGGIATMLAAWPLVTLVMGRSWAWLALLLVTAVVVSGIVGRMLRIPDPWVIAGQSLVLASVAVLRVAWRTLSYGLPTSETVEEVGLLLREAVETISTFSAPVPDNPGVTFVVSIAIGWIALLVDAFATGARSVALAGIPLVCLFLAAASNTGHTLPLRYYLAAGTAWLVMIGYEGVRRVGHWVTTDVATTRGDAEMEDARGTRRYGLVARNMAMTALVLSVAVPVILPATSPRFFLPGLGRAPVAGGGTGVALVNALDVTGNLTSGDNTPVLTYETTDRTPPPLRVAVATRFDGRTWVPRQANLAERLTTFPSVEALGIDPQVAAELSAPDFRVIESRLEAPQLAAPYPAIAGDVERHSFRIDAQTGVVTTDEKPGRYSFTYLALPSRLPRGVTGPEPENLDPELLEVPEASRAALNRALSEALRTDPSTTFDQAVAIQDYLRDAQRFSYSLTLAPAAPGADPISSFLASRQGYCVQFSTAMVMMARQAGIPAREVIGFLPGRIDGTRRQVRSSDAHAWPELYIRGMGWVRFEPTPGARAVAPAYTRTRATQPTASTSGPSSTRRNEERPTQSRTSTTASAPTGVPWRSVAVAALVLLGLALLASVLPLLAWRARRRTVSGHRDDAGEIEASWLVMRRQLADLGIPDPGPWSPRNVVRRYTANPLIHGSTQVALESVGRSVEMARYARPGTLLTDISDETERVVDGVRSELGIRERAAALLWPKSGRQEARRMAQRSRDVLATPWRWLRRRVVPFLER